VRITVIVHWRISALDLVIASYGMLQSDAGAFAAQHWHSVVLDEAQVIKNAATKRSQAAMALTADFKMIASGTPVENHLGELWNLFRFINPGLLGSKERFTDKFSTPIERGDKPARQHLKKLIQPFILRRTKTQVLTELPPRTEITLQVELSDEERHLYEALRQEAMDKIASLSAEEGQSLKVLAEITKLRRFCCHPQLVLKIPRSAAASWRSLKKPSMSCWTTATRRWCSASLSIIWRSCARVSIKKAYAISILMAARLRLNAKAR
jgi:SNF2 family DNA or RNA helicase